MRPTDMILVHINVEQMSMRLMRMIPVHINVKQMSMRPMHMILVLTNADKSYPMYKHEAEKRSSYLKLLKLAFWNENLADLRIVARLSQRRRDSSSCSTIQPI